MTVWWSCYSPTKSLEVSKQYTVLTHWNLTVFTCSLINQISQYFYCSLILFHPQSSQRYQIWGCVLKMIQRKSTVVNFYLMEWTQCKHHVASRRLGTRWYRAYILYNTVSECGIPYLNILCCGGKHVTLCEHQEKVTIYFFLVQKEILTLKTIVKEKNICWFDDLTSSGMNATSQQKQFYFVLSAVIS